MVGRAAKGPGGARNVSGWGYLSHLQHHSRLGDGVLEHCSFPAHWHAEDGSCFLPATTTLIVIVSDPLGVICGVLWPD